MITGTTYMYDHVTAPVSAVGECVFDVQSCYFIWVNLSQLVTLVQPDSPMGS